MMTRPNIICFSTADWDTPLPTNKHHLMRRLAARGTRVLFIETLGTRAPKLSSGVDVARIGRRIARGFEGARKRGRNLWTLSPLVRPRWNSRAAIELNRIAFRTQVAPVAKGFPDAIAWVYSPYAVYLIQAIKPSHVVYHAVDDLSAVPGADVAAIREAEARLLACADLVICSERSLYERMRKTNSNTHFLPNVADYTHFSKPRTAKAESLEALRGIAAPRIVFSGNLTPHKVDFALLDAIARKNPAWNLVLIGPVWEGVAGDTFLSRLKGNRNVKLLGHVPYNDLPDCLHEADALIIPYIENDATRAVFPLKLFEYLATGKPVVASALPSLLPYAEAIRIANSPREWSRALTEVLANPEIMRDQRIALARRHTWSKRVKEIELLLSQLTGK
ncbi:glycosyltransferase [Candidatus Sumerlaeota bacterium]|nr:glycosyltransferase [Candidatus Sumerlaeota bacterium]